MNSALYRHYPAILAWGGNVLNHGVVSCKSVIIDVTRLIKKSP